MFIHLFTHDEIIRDLLSLCTKKIYGYIDKINFCHDIVLLISPNLEANIPWQLDSYKTVFR